MTTKIEYADDVVNDQGGCDKIRAGCKNCYAIPFGPRLAAMGHKQYEGVVKDGNWTGRINFNEDARNKVLLRKKPTTYFWNSMSDAFHEEVPDDFLDPKFKVMADTPQHLHLVFTKRYYKAAEYLVRRTLFIPKNPVLNNVVIIFSVSNQQDLVDATYRIRGIARVGWRIGLSLEPLLERVDFSSVADCLDRVYCGGESGRKARPMHAAWARHARYLCAEFNIRFTFKQWGDGFKYTTLPSAERDKAMRAGCRPMAVKKGGRFLDGRIHDGA